MVHRRQIEGREVVFGNQGALFGRAMTWWDHDTGSIWSQPLGKAIAGELKGTTVELLASTLTNWGAWKQGHPQTVALDAPGSHGGFDLDDMVIVVEFGEASVGYPVIVLRELGVVNDEVSEVPIAVVVEKQDPESWAVFSRKLNDRIVRLSYENETLIDQETGSTWDPKTGTLLAGPLAGQHLGILPAFTSFPRDFGTFFPNGYIWQQ